MNINELIEKYQLNSPSKGRSQHKIMIIAGEASGDLLGAQLIKALRHKNPLISFCGVGGYAMQEKGFTSLFPMQEISIMGIVEILPKLWQVFKRLSQVKRFIKVNRPKVLVTIDSPGFNKIVAKYAKKIGIPVIHYVAPSVWAWKPGRAKTFAKIYDCVLCLLPFEPRYFQKCGLRAEFVGHSVLENHLEESIDFRKNNNIPLEATLICFLPGSRSSEIQRHLPIFMETFAKMQSSQRLYAILPTLDHLKPEIMQTLSRSKLPIKVVTGHRNKWQAFMHSSVALAASGTVSLELAYAGVPHVVTYKVNYITFILLRLLLKINYVSLINILLNHQVIPELLQKKCNPNDLSKIMDALLENTQAQKNMRYHFFEAMQLLKPGTMMPSQRAAEVVLEYVNDHQHTSSYRDPHDYIRI